MILERTELVEGGTPETMQGRAALCMDMHGAEKRGSNFFDVVFDRSRGGGMAHVSARDLERCHSFGGRIERQCRLSTRDITIVV